MDHQLKWYPGRPGKGMVEKDGTVHTWATFGPEEMPDHVVHQDKHDLSGHFMFHISPEGTVHAGGGGYLNQFREKDDADILSHIFKADPKLRAVPSDAWMVQNDSPGLALTAGTQYEPSEHVSELQSWLQSFQPAEAEELSPHHTSPIDFLPDATHNSDDNQVDPQFPG